MHVSSRSRTSLIKKILESKKYRNAYVAEHVRNGIPFQIRAMRDDKEWTQVELGKEAGKPQNVISRLEDPNYGKLTIQTLLEIASAFDVALLVKFVPFSRLLKEYEDVSPAALSAKSINKEIGELERWAVQDDEAIKDTLNAVPSKPLRPRKSATAMNQYKLWERPIAVPDRDSDMIDEVSIKVEVPQTTNGRT